MCYYFTMRKPLSAHGFTLIELVIVIMLISVLGGLIMVFINASGVNAKARDSQRIKDLKVIQTALELYYQDNNGEYPLSADEDPTDRWMKVEDSLMTKFISYYYLETVPNDPLNDSSTADPCSDLGTYRYSYKSDGSYYLLTALMEVPTSDDPSTCVQLRNWGQSGCSDFATQDVCYGLENP